VAKSGSGSSLEQHPLVELKRLRQREGVIGRRKAGPRTYILSFDNGSEETWEFDVDEGRFRLTELTCLAEVRKERVDEW
jgi:hypothetical protein